jgi:16S rRNA C967 or C1407 C5-methylase (RsmB/RsmF family)
VHINQENSGRFAKRYLCRQRKHKIRTKQLKAIINLLGTYKASNDKKKKNREWLTEYIFKKYGLQFHFQFHIIHNFVQRYFKHLRLCRQ